eukprot:1370865-Rhodomonas_salina.2
MVERAKDTDEAVAKAALETMKCVLLPSPFPPNSLAPVLSWQSAAWERDRDRETERQRDRARLTHPKLLWQGGDQDSDEFNDVGAEAAQVPSTALRRTERIL